MPEMTFEEIADKRKFSSHDGVVYRAAKMPKSFNEGMRSATFVMTDETEDSYGDIVRAKGGDLTRFESNPIALLNHQRDLMLGTWSDVKRIGKRIEGTVTLAEEGTAPHVDMAHNLMRQGILRAASIGFIPKDWELIRTDDGDWTGGIDWTEWEMTECSVVSVPANPAALAKSIKQGNPLALEFIEQVLDTYTKTGAGLIVTKSSLEDIRKEGLGKGETVTVPDLGEGHERSADDLHDDEGGEEDVAEKSLSEVVISVNTDDAEARMSSLTKHISAATEGIKSLMSLLGMKREVEVAEPEYVEGSLDRAKGIQARMKEIAAKHAA